MESGSVPIVGSYPSANEEERKKNENITMDEHIIMYTVKLQSNFIVIILATSVPS